MSPATKVSETTLLQLPFDVLTEFSVIQCTAAKFAVSIQFL